jgi:hypothetical protein
MMGILIPFLSLVLLNLLSSSFGYIPFKYKGDKFNNSFVPNTLKIWNALPSHIQFKNIEEFKLCTKKKKLNLQDINTLQGDPSLATSYSQE